MKEIWKKIKKYPNYMVSNYGRIKREPPYFISLSGLIKPQLTNNGRFRVPLCKNNKFKKFLVSRLVAQAFLPNLQNLPEVNHIDGNPKNNKVSNLEWCTRSYNMLHAFKIGLHSMPKGEKCAWSKLTNKSVLKIRKIYSQGNISMKKLGTMFGITNETVHGIIHKKYWSHI
jgi:hypothetical protein